MSDNFAALILPVITKEGGSKVTDDPNDSGGLTKWGVTEARARAAGYTGRMEDMTMAQAITIYRVFYWEQPQLDKLDAMCPKLSALLLDFDVNFGVGTPGKFVQRALNVLNNRASLWADLTMDGQMGAMTRAALAAFLKQRGDAGLTVLLGMVRAQASVDYIEIAESKPQDEEFEYGWQIGRALGVVTN